MVFRESRLDSLREVHNELNRQSHHPYAHFKPLQHHALLCSVLHYFLPSSSPALFAACCLPRVANRIFNISDPLVAAYVSFSLYLSLNPEFNLIFRFSDMNDFILLGKTEGFSFHSTTAIVARRVSEMSSTAWASIAFNSASFGELAKRQIVGSAGKLPLQNVKFRSVKAELSREKVRIAILGASGYTGAELTRLLVNHPFADIALMTADRKAGQSFGSVFPHLDTQDLPNLVAIADADFSDVDAVFCCLPHGTTQDIIKGLPGHLKIIDLSADFRMQDTAVYKEAYGQDHRAPELQKIAEYGLTEIKREEIRKARLVANPGCYPTSIQLPLIPLFKAGLLELNNIIIDAKSGVSGAGRSPKESLLYAELREGIFSYGITNHRHVYEIEQGLSEVVNSNVTVSFTPHLMPMSRGMQSTIYVEMAPGVNIEDLYNTLRTSYEDEFFVKLLKKGDVPHTNHVSGSNYCKMNVFPDRIPGRAIIVSVIDNLVKGASGQALQNFNVMFGFPETTGLLYQPLFP
ncbi:unnamed protein product [Rhodiola kirilowii]